MSATILAVLVAKLQVQEIGQHLGQISFGAVAWIAVMFLVQIALAVYRWSLIARRIGIPLGFAPAARYLMEGAFLSQVLPSAVGGDALRVMRAGYLGGAFRTAFVSVVADRLSGVVALVFMSALFAGFLEPAVQQYPQLRPVALAISATIVLCTVVAVIANRRGLVTRLALSVRFVGTLIADALTLLSFRSVFLVMGLSLAITVLAVAQIYSIATAVGAQLRFEHCLALVPPCLLAQVLPISIAGWGIREVALVLALGVVGVSPERAVATSIAYGLAVLLTSLPGSLLLVVGGKKRSTTM